MQRHYAVGWCFPSPPPPDFFYQNLEIEIREGDASEASFPTESF
ncbi:hypothetical protein QOZ95_002774 [Paenibacillus brasilensis]|uniref:Uncharacterized protein n=1 Tax=Paenibacillus brasilensis TaxID=128574 RepID=A0ABU0KZ94_9BACL|nr:hypothetical protein [Paenibacillus brasilensis]